MTTISVDHTSVKKRKLLAAIVLVKVLKNHAFNLNCKNEMIFFKGVGS